MLQWLGGLGIIVMAVAVLPMLQIGGMQVFKAEAFDTPEKILPRATQISTSMTIIFVAMTRRSARSPTLSPAWRADDALIHAMTTVATGGFSTKRQFNWILHQDPAIEWIAVVFMMRGFDTVPALCPGATGAVPSRFWRDQQVKDLCLTVSGVCSFSQDGSMARSFSENHFGSRKDAFRAIRFSTLVSVMTGTGYASADYGLWGAHVDRRSSSLSCSLAGAPDQRVLRNQDIPVSGVVRRGVRQNASRRCFIRTASFVKRFNGRPLQDPRVPLASVMTFIFLYLDFLRWCWLDRCCN
jgi:trk system potassium uptake protein TrkH